MRVLTALPGCLFVRCRLRAEVRAGQMVETFASTRHLPPARLARAILGSGARGRTRLILFLARRMRVLQAVPLQTSLGATLYADLRVIASHSLLMGMPFEPEVQAVMRRVVRRDDTALDIGAHVGAHTVFLSQLVGPEGQVYTFEPNSALLPALARTVGELSNTVLCPLALSDQSRASALYVPGDPSMASLKDWVSKADWTTPAQRKTRVLPCEERRLDELIVQRVVRQPEFIKCDVEGAELLVFQGGRGCLDRADAPILLFEAFADAARGFDLTASSATDFLSGLRSPCYSFFEVGAEGQPQPLRTGNVASSNLLAKPLRPGRPQGHRPVDSRSYTNILAMPRARMHRWPELDSRCSSA